MSRTNELVVLRLVGPFQAWGGYEIGDDRDGSDHDAVFPTKSGIVGMIACAMGLRRGDSKILELSKAITIASRADRPGRPAEDYQTVSGTMQANGLHRSSAVVSRRKYIEDGCFTVFVSADQSWLEEIENAMNDPVWPIFLGRANCIPGEPVFRGRTSEYKNMLDAITRYPMAKRSATYVQYEMEKPFRGAYSYSRQDVIVKGKRNFIPRTAWKSGFTVKKGRG